MELKINNKIIKNDLFEKEINYLKQVYQEKLTPKEFETIKDKLPIYAKENVISRVLINEEAEKLDEEVSFAEIKKEFERMKEFYGGDEKFYKTLNKTPKDDFEIKSRIEKSLKVELLLDKICPKNFKISDVEVKKFYESNREKFIAPDRVHVAHILLKFESQGDDQKKEIESLTNKLEGVRDLILIGKSFFEAAKEFSNCPSAHLGGDLGFIKNGETEPEFEKISFTTKEGDVSPVFFTKHGAHIIKVYSKKKAGIQDFDEVESLISKKLTFDERNKRIKDFSANLRKKASIEVLAE